MKRLEVNGSSAMVLRHTVVADPELLADKGHFRRCSSINGRDGTDAVPPWK